MRHVFRWDTARHSLGDDELHYFRQRQTDRHFVILAHINKRSINVIKLQNVPKRKHEFQTNLVAEKSLSQLFVHSGAFLKGNTRAKKPTEQ